MYCNNCNQTMEGGGYTVVYHCPDASEIKVQDKEPDANPVYCDLEEI